MNTIINDEDNSDNPTEWQILWEQCRSLDPDAALELVSQGLKQTDSVASLGKLIEPMISFIGLPDLLPPNYEKFRPLLIHGITFVLSRLPLERVSHKIVDQIYLPPETSSGQRICQLVNDMPTLQKLGQVICRNPGLDPSFKEALISLEDQVNTVTWNDIEPEFRKQVEISGLADRLDVDESILAEASVCTVTPATLRSRDRKTEKRVVLKLVKPSVRNNLTSELEIFNQLADYFDRHKQEWGLGGLRFRDMFAQVRHLIENEVDLSIEQSNLIEAAVYYRKQKDVIVPKAFATSLSGMTIMSKCNGKKITDVEHLSPAQKRRLASRIVDICILKPIKDTAPVTIFHGDPHAGNIAYWFNGKSPRIILYDWGMMGHLDRSKRYAIAMIAFGILAGTPKPILFAVQMVARVKNHEVDTLGLHDTVEEVLSRQKKRLKFLFTTMEELFEALMNKGVVFPPDFLMFEKALVTLEGVLADIDPDFSRDQYLVWAVLKELYLSVVRMRFQFFILRKIFSLYRYGFLELFKFQKSVLSYAAQFGFSRLTPIPKWWSSDSS